jgi:hypothetical protein
VGPHPIIGFLDPRTHTVYAAERATERVKTALKVKQVQGNTWVVGYPDLIGTYRVKSLNSLNLKMSLCMGMAAVNENCTCLKTAKGECSNMYTKDDTFTYSWKAPKELFQCTYTKEQDCTDIWKEETIDVYTKENCQGDPKSQVKKIAFCNPV